MNMLCVSCSTAKSLLLVTPDTIILTTNFQTLSGTVVSQGDDTIELAALIDAAYDFVLRRCV